MTKENTENNSGDNKAIEEEFIEVYFNPELPESFARVSEAIKVLKDDMLNVAVDMQVANPEDDTFLEFGGLCVEIQEQIHEMYKMLGKTKRHLDKENEKHVKLQEFESLL